jgi:hypothetical protein
MLRRESPLTTSEVLPYDLSLAFVQGVDISIVTGKIDEPVGQCRRGIDAATGFEFPALDPVGKRQRVQVVIIAAYEDSVVSYGG